MCLVYDIQKKVIQIQIKKKKDYTGFCGLTLKGK